MLRKLLPLKPQMLLNPNTAVFKKKKKSRKCVTIYNKSYKLPSSGNTPNLYQINQLRSKQKG